MNLEHLIRSSFTDGLSYNEAAQLCLRLYRTVDGIPESVHQECTRENLTLLFAALSSTGLLNTRVDAAALYGANFHEVCDKWHWIEVLASIFKMDGTVDEEAGEVLASRLTRN